MLRAVLIEGDPGIGKTTLWEAGAAAAEALNARVLSCRPAAAEVKLAFASLADLLSPLVDAEHVALPEPQRLALDVALLRASPSRAQPDQRAVGTAVQSLLAAAAADRRLVVAIDDLQWIDAASAAALGFALRRLTDSRVRVLAAARSGEPRADLGIQPERLRLAPLSLSGIHHVINAQVGHAFPRPALRRIAEASGGNPLYAVELARALDEVGTLPGPGEPLPVPSTLTALMEERIGRLDAPARRALLAAAALGDPTVALVTAAVGTDAGPGLDAAERARVVTLAGGRVAFAHPLFASTVYTAAPTRERQEVHAMLAAAVASSEEQARHLALAADGPDEFVAARLEAAAHDAARRAAPQAAAELAGLAVQLTPATEAEAAGRRSLELAEQVFRTGDTAEAQRLAVRFVAVEPAGPLRARALELLARMEHVAGTSSDAVLRGQQALAEAGEDVELRARVLATLARVDFQDLSRAAAYGREALALLDALPEPDPALVTSALCAEIGSAVSRGEPLPRDLVDRALELEGIAPLPDVADRVSAALGAWLKLLGEFEEARRWLEVTRQAAIDEGDDASLPYALSHLPQLDLWTGRWDDAERHAIEHLDLAEAMAQPSQRRQALFNLALVHAHQGRVDAARVELDALSAEAAAVDDTWDIANALAVRGFLALSLGEAAEACDLLEQNIAIRDAISREALRAHVDFSEALVELGRLDEAEAVLDTLQSRASERAPLLALVASHRALVEASRGDVDTAMADVAVALDVHERTRVPFDRARTLLIAGRIRRRRGERKLARVALGEAREIFHELGAQLWCDRAEAELARIPIRRGAGDELTPTEERVAELAAAGRTNRQVAHELFMSAKTVEANLARIYRKLGIGSRAELGAAMAGREPAKP